MGHEVIVEGAVELGIREVLGGSEADFGGSGGEHVFSIIVSEDSSS